MERVEGADMQRTDSEPIWAAGPDMSVMKRLRMPQHGGTEVRSRTPAVCVTPGRLRTFSHEPFIINKSKIEQTTIAEDAMKR
jgi:hypothetical protein